MKRFSGRRGFFCGLSVVPLVMALALSPAKGADKLPLITPEPAQPAVRRVIAEQPFRIPSDIGDVCSSGDRKTLFVTHLNENRVSLLNAETGLLTGQLPVERATFAVSPIGTHFSGCRADATSRQKPFGMWSWPQRELLWEKSELRPLLATFSPDGTLLAVLCHGRKPSLRSGFEIQVLEVTDGKLLWQTDLEQTGDAAFPLGLAFMGNGVLVSSAEQAGPLLRAFAARTGKPLEVPDLKNLEKPHLAAAAEAPVLVAYSNLGLCVLRLDKKGQFERVFEDVPKNWTGLYGFRGAAASPDGQSVLVTTAEECRVYRTENGEQLPPIRIRGEQAHFLADGKTAFVGFDGALVPVSSSPWKPRHQHGYMGHVSSITDLRYSPDGKRLASTDGETLVLWNPENGTALARMPGPTADYWIQALAFHPKESLVYASTGAEVWWWDYAEAKAAQSGLPIDAAEPPKKRVMHMFEPPKQMLTATLALDASGQRLLRTANGFADWLDLGPDPRAVALKMRQVTPTEGPNGLDPIWQSAVSPDGNRVVFGGSSAVRVYESGQITTYAAPRERVLSPDGRLFAVFPSATEKQVTIRDTEKGAAQAALAVVPADGQPKPVSALAWSADGTRVATATYYQSEAKSVLNVWEVKTAAHLASVETRRGKIHHMAFSPDARTLAVANADGTIELWDAEKIPAPARK